MSAHTPGPWKWGEGWSSLAFLEEGITEKYLDLQLKCANGDDVISLRVDHYRVEIDYAVVEGKPVIISEADRALIAAAPDLLKALQIVVASGPLNNGMRDDGAMEWAREAIAKATGDSK